MPDPKPSTAAPRLKLVIRRLPPTIPEEIFWRSVSEWVDGGKSTWRRWYQGKKADE
jgi:regulator of nonsense transcripts 3